jgi:NAD(P)-dependent dehydrogenase (short-subunit alcohol dehydrogenase family)
VAEELNGANLHTVAADCTRADDVARAFKHATELGPLHVLVNGVGSSCSGGLRDLSPVDWQRKFELNLTSVFLCTRAALPLLEAASGDRVVIMISSTLATVADPSTIAYCAFKAGLEQFTRALALELAPQGIRAVAVAPGPISATGGEADFETQENMRLNPLRRFARPDEIAETILWLSSPAAAYITGTVLRVDGGDAALGIGWGPASRIRDG